METSKTTNTISCSQPQHCRNWLPQDNKSKACRMRNQKIRMVKHSTSPSPNRAHVNATPGLDRSTISKADELFHKILQIVLKVLSLASSSSRKFGQIKLKK
ncbi:uncharacterized protein LOC116926206 [Daphnia magna]|uniref:uncharacterized protein LOC116926206 n=1 Tax=Daphnia magna TaxID=35525 RepID=UPI00140358F5|nr:uncharacterized protein LOC116926206 [Daphnia magna]